MPKSKTIDEIEQQMRELVVAQLFVDPGDVTLGSVFTDDLGANSLDIVELVIAIEDKRGIEIGDAVMDIRTFGELVDEVCKARKLAT